MGRSRKAISSGNLKELLSFFLLGFFLLFVAGSAWAQVDSKTSNSTQSIQDIEKRLDQIEQNQQTMLKNQEQILEELKTLRVWVHRR